MRSRSPDKAVRRYPGQPPPVALRLPRLQSECDRVARIRRLRCYPGPLSPVALRLARLRSECVRVARIRRYAAIRDRFPDRAALTAATKRMRSRSPDKAVRRYPGPLPPVALRLPRLQSVCDRVARIRRLRRYPGVQQQVKAFNAYRGASSRLCHPGYFYCDPSNR